MCFWSSRTSTVQHRTVDGVMPLQLHNKAKERQVACFYCNDRTTSAKSKQDFSHKNANMPLSRQLKCKVRSKMVRRAFAACFGLSLDNNIIYCASTMSCIVQISHFWDVRIQLLRVASLEQQFYIILNQTNEPSCSCWRRYYGNSASSQNTTRDTSNTSQT